MKWTLSRLRIEPVTQAIAQSAAAFLRELGPHIVQDMLGLPYEKPADRTADLSPTGPR
ncbi:hypothetical protein [Nocardia sp. NBC_01329]|uniref:hypothetical protein n=1 Tax=Nocardia sp. NBC_01329 TaxID=2903594 RepID=UPI002E15BEF6|nr:hypothetical protein OG405_16455 [Nocardia sp. NBC_01329]